MHYLCKNIHLLYVLFEITFQFSYYVVLNLKTTKRTEQKPFALTGNKCKLNSLIFPQVWSRVSE